MGYEGLSIDITLSSKFLVPLVEIMYTKKAPACANIDEIEDKLRDHYGKIYTDPIAYQKEVLDVEKILEKYGNKVSEVTSYNGKKYDLHKVNVLEKDFKDKQFYLQSMLIWFIDGAS